MRGESTTQRWNGTLACSTSDVARRNAWLRDNSLHNGNKSMAQEYGGEEGRPRPRKFRLLSRHAAQSRRGYYSLKCGCRLTAVPNVATPRDVLFSLPLLLLFPSVRHLVIHPSRLTACLDLPPPPPPRSTLPPRPINSPADPAPNPVTALARDRIDFPSAIPKRVRAD